MKEMMIENFAMKDLQLKIEEDRKVAMCTRFTKRARMGYKIEFNIRFHSVERMYEYCVQYLKDLQRAEEYKEQRKLERAAQRAAAKVATNVGDIFVASWGYEQTNVDAYQVVEKKGATVTLREIALQTVEGSQVSHGMADQVVPVKDAFIGEEFKKRLTGRGINIDSVRYASPMGERESFYRSWYA
jgi:hypothetical protein